MNGYIIVATDDETETPDKYWNGTIFDADINGSLLITDKVTARTTAGNLQGKYSQQEIKTVPAQVAITFGHRLAKAPEEVTV